MTNTKRPIDHAFDKIWEYFQIDQDTEAEQGWCSYSQTRLAILAAVRVAMVCDDSISTGHYYPPNSNEIVVRLREIQYPTAENIGYAQEAVSAAMGWEERLEEIIRIGAGTL